jgi:hypothetical protein
LDKWVQAHPARRPILATTDGRRMVASGAQTLAVRQPSAYSLRAVTEYGVGLTITRTLSWSCG